MTIGLMKLFLMQALQNAGYSNASEIAGTAMAIFFSLANGIGRIAWFTISINRPMSGNVKYDAYQRGDFDPIDDGETTGKPWLMGRTWIDIPI